MSKQEMGDEYTLKVLDEVQVDFIMDGTIKKVTSLDVAMVGMLRTGECEYVWQMAEVGGWQ